MNPPTNLDEYDAIAKTVQYYTDGAKSGRGADMQPAFHQDATIFGYADGEIFAGPIQKLFESVDQDTPATGLQARMVSIDIINTIAAVWRSDPHRLLDKLDRSRHAQNLLL
jgi:Putative lumazine-binding